MERSPEEAALLADIYANLDDDGPRHVYADWLLSRGDLRGALINVQCWLERATGEERRALQQEAQRLYRWYGPHPVLPGGHCREVRRGFLAAVTITDLDAFLKGQVLSSLPTLEEVAVSGRLEPQALSRLIRARGFDRIRALCLQIAPEAVPLLAAVPLRALRLDQLSRESAARLLSSLRTGPALSGLERLTVGGEGVDPALLSELMNLLPRLTSLTVREGRLNPIELLALTEHPALPRLRELALPRYPSSLVLQDYQEVVQWLKERMGGALDLI